MRLEIWVSRLENILLYVSSFLFEKKIGVSFFANLQLLCMQLSWVHLTFILQMQLRFRDIANWGLVWNMPYAGEWFTLLVVYEICWKHMLNYQFIFFNSLKRPMKQTPIDSKINHAPKYELGYCCILFNLCYLFVPAPVFLCGWRWNRSCWISNGTSSELSEPCIETFELSLQVVIDPAFLLFLNFFLLYRQMDLKQLKG